jgi:hypothetical protein
MGYNILQFTSSGTWTCPSSVAQISIIICSGGQGGQGIGF